MEDLGDRQRYLLAWFARAYRDGGAAACGLTDAAVARDGASANYGSYRASADSLVARGLLQEVRIPGARGFKRGYLPTLELPAPPSALSELLG